MRSRALFFKETDMRYVPPAYEHEVLTDTSARTDAAIARRRMGRITATDAEAMRYKCAPLQARDNDRPGIPMDGYGMMTDD
jgi:hypothetical protein